MAYFEKETFTLKEVKQIVTDIETYTIQEFKKINPEYPCTLEIFIRRPTHLHSDKTTIQSNVSNVAKDYMRFMKELQGEVAGQNRRVLIDTHCDFREETQYVYQP